MLVSDFDYDLPAGAIAQSAIEPRDASRLLVTSTLENRTFAELPSLLDPGDLLVVNRTRVRAARLTGHKADSGGRVEVLLTKRLDANRWQALVRPAKRVREGTELAFRGLSGRVLSSPDRGEITLSLVAEAGDPEDVLALIGETPLPPYFHGTLSDAERYQTVFAKTSGSAAAPTAGLHFTNELLVSLAAAEVAIAEVELEVGLDTFRPMTAERVEEHLIHRERYAITDDAVAKVQRCQAEDGRVIAVGTTVVRALETAGSGGTLTAASGETDLFITPGYRRRIIDGAITNFHAPRSTLLVMIAALLGPRWRAIYQHALGAGYRFLSFGDAMFIDDPVEVS